ncbi:tetratricopeptide repeat protein [Deinococcus cellulosilyticus]|uniref:Uncharacterized protein n=1 Tax=Deinococcus cellulosilyticus (strain DSM 18568 / NBRC 106333 / KACC 11606 / 5516J-15) TaxID=1223518 RepID=A0A511N1Z1_DEIC1|nr:tetratricopeptide repeat protein [Deinococcus cellulosilyticus]GEM46872.1 hypothetical protein DC3_25070 [Deinococcus cellulosilyticus NBRC 106333 = KACC 11606]
MTAVSLLNGFIPLPLKNELTRTHVLEQLNAQQDARIIAVVAPSGYGKTTLLAQMARMHPEASVWITLTPNESEPVQLHTTCTRALKSRFPHLTFRHSLEVLQHTWNPERAAVALVRDLDLLEVNLKLFFDQGEHLGPDAVRWLNAFVGALSEGHQVVVSAFDAQPLRLSQLMVRRQAVIVGTEELAFSVQESQQLLHLPPKQAESIHQQYEGWPVCISLVAAGAGNFITPEDLLEDTLQNLEPETLHWLQEASVLDTWSEARFELHHIPCPLDWERQLKQAGLPILPLGRNQYRPHSILLQVLQKQLKRKASRFTELHRSAARVAESEHRFLEAILHHQAIKDTAAALQVTGRVVKNLLGRYEYSLIRHILELFHPSELSSDLKYLLSQAWIETGELAKAEQMLQTLHGADLQARVLMLRAFLANRRGAAQETLQLCNQALKCSEDPETTIPLLRLKGWELVHLGQYDPALEVFQEALRLSAEDPTEQAHVRFMLAYTREQKQEKFEQIEEGYLEAIRAYEAVGGKRSSVYVLIQVAELYANLGQYDRSKAYLDRAYLACEGIEDSFLTLILEGYGDLFSLMGSYSEALEAYSKALAASQKTGGSMHDQRIRYKMLEVHLKGKTPFDVLLAEVQSRSVPDDLYRNIYVFYEALLSLHRKDFLEARRQLQSIQHASVGTYRRIRLNVLLGALKKRQGEDTAVEERLVLELSQGRSLPCLQQDLSLMQDLQALPARAAVSPPRLSEEAVPGLSIQATLFGMVKFRYQNHTFTIKHKKSCEVLVWLLLHGPSTRDRIINDLHDGENSSKHIDYFKVAVRRLRSSIFEETGIEINPVVFENGMYTVAEQLNFRVDHLELEAQVRTLDSAALEKVTTVYRQEFMPGFESSWIERLRLRIQDTLLLAYQKRMQLETHPTLKLDLGLEVLEHLGLQEELLEQLNDLLEDLDSESTRMLYLQKLRAIKKRWLET